MSRCARVLGRVPASRGQRGREPLVEGVDRYIEHLTKRFEEPLRLADLRAALAAERQRKPDDDALSLLVPHELGEARESPFRGRALHDAERPGQRARRV